MADDLLGAEDPTALRNASAKMRTLILLGVVSWVIYLVFSWLSRDFGYETPVEKRPLFSVFALLFAAFVCYLPALHAAVRAEGHRDLLPVIWILAIAFRATVLLTEPFQEVDLYRYLWDGQVVADGVSPYRYSPGDVLNAKSGDVLPDDLRRLVALRDSDRAIATALSRIHFNRLTTLYPPVSQAVFALSATVTPRGSDLWLHLALMKFWIVTFDLLTLFVLIKILRYVGKPVGWSVAYAWCPLVVKEFANSGHLDSIAVCLTSVSVYFTLRAFFPRKKGAPEREPGSGSHSRLQEMTFVGIAGVSLGLAIGAKLFPSVLSLLLASAARRRRGWRVAIFAAMTTAVVAACTLLPMFTTRNPSRRITRTAEDRESVSPENRPVTEDRPPPIPAASESFQDLQDLQSLRAGSPAKLRRVSDSVPPLPNGAVASEVKSSQREQKSSEADGLRAFFSRWKMNDFLFRLVEENVTIPSGKGKHEQPWFAVTPFVCREFAVRNTQSVFAHLSSASGLKGEISDGEAAFLLARVITGAVFLILAVWFAGKVKRDGDAERFLELAFLTFAWFWLLQPTQNPWYWTWALPFLPFARGRVWLALSGLVLIYYLRFWFGAHLADIDVLGTGYRGTAFFDSVLVLLEFGPWFAGLAYTAARRKKCRSELVLQ